MFITQRHLSRRNVLKGLGAAIALPVLDAMTPAMALSQSAASTPTRLICIEMVHGAAGSSAIGLERNLWAPSAVGRDFALSSSSLNSLAAFREHLTIISNTDVACAEPYTAREIGGDHFRSSAVFLTQAHPKLTDGADVEAGISLDQIYAARAGQDTPIPSMQLCIEDVNQGGACGFPEREEAQRSRPRARPTTVASSTGSARPSAGSIRISASATDGVSRHTSTTSERSSDAFRPSRSSTQASK